MRSPHSAQRSQRASLLTDAGDAAVSAPGQAHDGMAGAPLPVVGAEDDEPAVGMGGFDASGVAGDGPPAVGADPLRVRGHPVTASPSLAR